MKIKLSIFGIGGHSRVVIEAALLNGFVIDSLNDDDLEKLNTCVAQEKRDVPIDVNFIGALVIAIGNNKSRKQISERFSKANWQTIIHPSAIIAKDVVIGDGSVIMAGAIIQTGTKIGKHSIINTGSCIDHDCVIGDFVHIGPNSSLAGGVSVGEGTFIGIGSSVIPNRTVGSWTNVGAGSVIIVDQPSNCTTLGIPAKPIKFNNEPK